MNASIGIRILCILLLTHFLWGCDNSDNTSNGPVRVSFQLLNEDGVPIVPRWLAFQDGDGPWERITTPDEDLVYRRMVADVAGRYAFAFVGISDYPVNIMAATTAEATHLTELAFQWPLPETEIHVTGTVTDVAADESWHIGLGPRIAYPTEESATDYDLGVPVPGIYDVLAARLDTAGVPERLWIRRQLSFTGDTVMNVAFDDPEFSTAGERTRVPVVNGALLGGRVTLQAGGGSRVITGSVAGTDGAASATAELNYLSLPSALAQPDDVTCASGEIEGVSLVHCGGQGMDLTLDFAGLFPFPPATLAGSTLSWSPYADATHYNFLLPGQESVRYTVTVSSGYVGAANRFRIPDLSMVDGWDTAWDFEPAESTEIEDSFAGAGNLSLGDVMRCSALNRFPAGARYWWAFPAEYADDHDILTRINGNR